MGDRNRGGDGTDGGEQDDLLRTDQTLADATSDDDEIDAADDRTGGGAAAESGAGYGNSADDDGTGIGSDAVDR